MRVPVGARQVEMGTLPDVRQRGAVGPDNFLGGTSAAAAGFGVDTLDHANHAAAEIYSKEVEQANHTRALDAVNQFEAKRQDALFGQAGAFNQRGAAVFTQQNSKPLTDNVLDDLSSHANDLAANLGNEEQRAMFNQHVQQSLQTTRGQLLQHEGEQYRVYRKGVNEAAIDTTANDMYLNFNNSAGLGVSANKIDIAARDLAKMQGLPPEAGDTLARQANSKALSGAIDAALAKQDTGSALKILHDHSSRMDADSWLKATNRVTEFNNQSIAYHAGNQAAMDAAAGLQTPNDVQIGNVIQRMESGGQHWDDEGNLIKSKAGAVGIGQIMPETGPEAAKAAGLPWHPELFFAKRSGNAEQDAAAVRYHQALSAGYYFAQLKQYGNMPMAFAAYNAGPGRVTEALAAAQKNGGDWKGYLPKETQVYVDKAMSAYHAGIGQNAKPTEADVAARSEANVLKQGVSDPQIIKAARETALSTFRLQQQAVVQRENEGLSTAYRWVEQNPGHFSAMPASVLNGIPAGKRDIVAEYGNRLSKGLPPLTNWNRYGELRMMAVTDPAAFKKLDLSLEYPHLSLQHREQLIDIKTKLNDPAQAPTVLALGGQLVNAHELLKFGSSDLEKKGKFDSAVTQAIAEESKTKGRDLNFEERQRVIIRMMLPVDNGNWFITNPKMWEVYGTPDQAGKKPVISKDDRAQIERVLAAKGEPINEQSVNALFNEAYGL